jgi:hypothetical protein
MVKRRLMPSSTSRRSSRRTSSPRTVLLLERLEVEEGINRLFTIQARVRAQRDEVRPDAAWVYIIASRSPDRSLGRSPAALLPRPVRSAADLELWLDGVSDPSVAILGATLSETAVTAGNGLADAATVTAVSDRVAPRIATDGSDTPSSHSQPPCPSAAAPTGCPIRPSRSSGRPCPKRR